MIETPLGEARFVLFDGVEKMVLVQRVDGVYQWFLAQDCYVEGAE